MLAREDRYIYLLYIQKLHRVKMRIPECHSAAPRFSHVVAPLLNKLLFLFCVRIPPTSRFFFFLLFLCAELKKNYLCCGLALMSHSTGHIPVVVCVCDGWHSLFLFIPPPPICGRECPPCFFWVCYTFYRVLYMLERLTGLHQ